MILPSAVDPKKITTNDVVDITASSDEDLDIFDQESVASSVDSSAEEMFIDGLDPVLDRWGFFNNIWGFALTQISRFNFESQACNFNID